MLKSCCYFADDTLIRLKFPWREGRQIKGLSSCPSLPHLHSHKGCFQLCPSDAGALPSLATQASNVKRELPARPPHRELPALFCVSRCSARSSSGSLSGLAGAQGGAPWTRQSRCGCSWRIRVPFCRGPAEWIPAHPVCAVWRETHAGR